jgi:hypothetical protein
MSDFLTKRDRYAEQLVAMKNDRSSFEAHWRELAQYIKPRRARFSSSERNRGDKRNQKIIDSVATIAARTCSAGMASAISSQARPWFKLSSPDYRLGEEQSVKYWLDQVRDLMLQVLGRSNFYQVSPMLYGDMAVFGTGVMLMDEDDESIVRFRPMPIGEYYLAIDSKDRIRTFARKFQLSVRQLVEMFGERDSTGKIDWSNFSRTVKDAWNRKSYSQMIDVVHIVQENDDYDESRLAAKHKRYTDCYYEEGSREPAFLRESGYDEWPVLAGRWEASAGDVYGTDCPGMTALGDIKQLQFGEKLSARAIELMVNPPTVAPSTMRNAPLSVLPGDVSYEEPNQTASSGFRPLFQTNLRVDVLEQKQQQVRARIDEAFFVDLFLMLDRLDERDRTATEIIERKEEKLLVLGPMYEGLNQGVFDPMIDRLFAILLRKGMLPDPPDVLQGATIAVEYTSVMAQAQKAIGRSGMDALVMFGTALVGASGGTDLSALDKLNQDEIMDEYADACGVPARVIRSDDDVAATRDQRAKAQQAAQAAEQMKTAAQGAQALSDTDTTNKNALTDILSGAGSVPQGAAA